MSKIIYSYFAEQIKRSIAICIEVFKVNQLLIEWGYYQESTSLLKGVFSSNLKCSYKSIRQSGHLLLTFSHSLAHLLWKMCPHGKRFML